MTRRSVESFVVSGPNLTSEKVQSAVDSETDEKIPALMDKHPEREDKVCLATTAAIRPGHEPGTDAVSVWDVTVKYGFPTPQKKPAAQPAPKPTPAGPPK